MTDLPEPMVKASRITELEASWRETLRKERDARLTEVRLKEKAQRELSLLRAEAPDFVEGFLAAARLFAGQYDEYAKLRDQYLASREKAK